MLVIYPVYARCCQNDRQVYLFHVMHELGDCIRDYVGAIAAFVPGLLGDELFRFPEDDRFRHGLRVIALVELLGIFGPFLARFAREIGEFLHSLPLSLGAVARFSQMPHRAQTWRFRRNLQPKCPCR